MTSPLNPFKDSQRLHQETFDCSISFQLKPDSARIKRRVPGKITSKLPNQEGQLIDELIALKKSSNINQSQLYDQLEIIVRSLLEKNEKLVEMNNQLKGENKRLKRQVKDLEYHVELLQNRGEMENNSFSIMSYFNSISLVPIVQPIDGNPYQLLEKNLCACKNDNNSNIRAFYLSMLQHKQTRKLLNELICHYQNDDSWKLVPLLSTNQSWVQLSVNFFKVLDSNDFQQIQEIYSFINESQLYDIIFISALRSRVQFMAEGYDTEIDTMQLFTALCNIFGSEKISFNRKQHVKYDTFSFELEETEFTIYFVQDINQYAVSFYQPERLFSSVESFQQSINEEQESEGREIEESSSSNIQYKVEDQEQQYQQRFNQQQQ